MKGQSFFIINPTNPIGLIKLYFVNSEKLRIKLAELC